MTFTSVSLILLWIIVLANVVLTLALLRRLAFINQQGPSVAAPPTPPGLGPALGTVAPDGPVSRAGEMTNLLAVTDGAPTVLGFFASDCASCVTHAAPFSEYAATRAQPDGVRCLALIDGVPDESQHLTSAFTGHVEILFAPRHRMSTFTNYNVITYPTFVRLSAQGHVIQVTAIAEELFEATSPTSTAASAG